MFRRVRRKRKGDFSFSSLEFGVGSLELFGESLILIFNGVGFLEIVISKNPLSPRATRRR